MNKDRVIKTVQIAVVLLIGMGAWVTLADVNAAINSLEVYLPIIRKASTQTPTSTPPPSPGEVCSNPSTPIPIPDEQEITDTIYIDNNQVISDLDVPLDISHTFVGDLVITLQHIETGTTVLLIDRAGYDPNPRGCRNDDILATLDDEASVFAEDLCDPKPPAISGEVAPAQPLSAFDGQSVLGNWRLTISDLVGGDEGSLNNWCLTFQ